MKRSSGEGTICKRADGRWAAALAVGGRRIWVYGKTRQEVAEKLRRLQGLAQSAGYLPEPGKLTLRDYLTLWLEQAGQRLRPKTLETYEQVTQSFILPHLGTTKLTRLSGLVLASFFTKLAKDGISPFRQRQAFALLHKALGDAVRWGLIPHNPASTIDRPKPKPAKRTIWPLSKQQPSCKLSRQVNVDGTVTCSPSCWPLAAALVRHWDCAGVM